MNVCMNKIVSFIFTWRMSCMKVRCASSWDWWSPPYWGNWSPSPVPTLSTRIWNYTDQKHEDDHGDDDDHEHDDNNGDDDGHDNDHGHDNDYGHDNDHGHDDDPTWWWS